RRDIDPNAVARVEPTAEANQVHHRRLHRLVTERAQVWLWARIDEQPRPGIDVAAVEGEWRDAVPADTDELLNRIADRDAVLKHEVVELQRLPSIRIANITGAGDLEDERWVHRRVAGVVGITAARALVGAVALAVGDHRRRD